MDRANGILLFSDALAELVESVDHDSAHAEDECSRSERSGG